MTIAAALAIGLIIGALGTWFLQREERIYLRKELATATDRLVHAWRDDKATIPPRPVEIVPEPPLPPQLQEIVDQWEDPESRANQAAQLRTMHFERRMGVMAILKHLENQHP